MNIIKLTPDKYEEWDRFCQESDDAWFWHTSAWLRYTLEYKPEVTPQDRSFFVTDNEKIVAVCPLVSETYPQGAEFSYGDNHGPTPALSNDLNAAQRHKILKLIFGRVDELAQEHSVKRAKFRFSVLNPSCLTPRHPQENFLTCFGYVDSSIASRVIDLSTAEDELWRQIRHGHQADIKRGQKSVQVEIYDADNVTKQIFDEYARLKYKSAGKVTRPQVTFDIMLEIIKNGNGFLAAARSGNRYLGFGYFFVYKDNVYYGSACNDPDSADLPVAHVIQWEAIKYMRVRGYKFYEIGWQVYPTSFSDFASPKEVDISHFKRGFGGFNVPLFMGEKYYDKDYFIKVSRKRLEKVAQSI